MSNAERQAAYRRRHLADPETVDSCRLNLVVPVTTGAKLERLANHYGVTKRALLARLLDEAENMVTSGVRGAELAAYYDGEEDAAPPHRRL